MMAVLLLRWVELRTLMHGARTFRLSFPRSTEATAVTVLLAGLSGVRPPWFWRWLRSPTVIFELHAEHGRIEHTVTVPRPLTGVVLTHLRAALPSVRYELLDNPAPLRCTVASELGLTTSNRPLRTDQLPAVAAAVIGSTQPLRDGEQVVVQWLFMPATVPKPPRLPGRAEQRGAVVHMDGYELLPHAEALRAERAKQAEPLLLAVGRVGVTANTPSRANYLTDRLLGSFHLLNAPGVQLKRRLFIVSAWAVHRIINRSVPLLVWPAVLNAAEATGVIGWPVGEVQALGLTLGGCRQLPPSADIPSDGCVVARSTFPGSDRLLAIAPDDRRLHAWCLGPTGSGKSTLLLGLITQDMHAGRGVVVVDPVGDLCANALKRVPPERVKDVIVLDPADDERPVGINLLDTTHAPAELVAEQVVFIFHQLFAAFWGPRTDDVLRAALLTLMHEPGMTLVEVPLLLNSSAFRRRFSKHINDDVIGLAPFWSWYEGLSAAERSQVIAPLMNKLRATLLRSRVRYCIGQDDPGLRLEEALSTNKLLFVPLRKGLLGQEAAALLGSLFVARLWQAVQARTALAPEKRRQVHLYIDEVQDYLHLPTSVGDMLAQARALALGVTVAHQHLGQLTPELKRDLLANCRSKVIFQCTAEDARVLERELRPHLTAEDLQGLARFEVVTQLVAGQRVAPPATGITLPPSAETHRSAAAMAWSRQHYGRNRTAIEAAMRTRHQVPAEPAPVGRKRRGGQP